MLIRATFALAISLSAARASALTPAPEPHNHPIFSANKRYYAAVSARSKTTVVKEVRRHWIDRTLWKIPGYLEWAMVADDGSMVLTYTWMVIPPFSKKQEVIWVYLPSGKRTDITLGALVKDLSKLELAMGMRNWGGVDAIEGEWLRVTTCEKKTWFVHSKSGEVRASKPASVQKN
jgi:hypothetical protein